MKIRDRQYLTLEDMESDLLLMVSNAKKYNDPKSQIYKVNNVHAVNPVERASVVGRVCVAKADRQRSQRAGIGCEEREERSVDNAEARGAALIGDRRHGVSRGAG